MLSSSSTTAVPALPPHPDDLVHLMLQVDSGGTVHLSSLAFNARVTSPPSPSSLPITASASSPLSSLSLPTPRIRVLGHTRSETKDGTPFIVYIVEYIPSQASKPFVNTVRFSDAYGLHRLLSLRFVCLPPFPQRTLLRSVGDEQLIREREEALSRYLQLVAMRADIREDGELESWLGLGKEQTAGSVMREDRKEREKSDSEREKDVDARMKVEDAAAERRRHAEREEAELRCPQFDLLIDQFHVVKSRHVDIDALKATTNKEHEMQQTTFQQKQTTQLSATIPAPLSSPPSSSSPSILPPPASATLSLLMRSPTFTVHRALVPSPLLLLLCCGDESRLAKLDHWLSGLFGSWSERKREEERRERERTKREKYVSQEEEAKAERERQEEQREAEYPLGAFYAFSRPTEAEAWSPSLSLFLEREVTEMVWDEKRGWCWLLCEDGRCHVYSPLQPDWGRVRKVWTIQLHSKSIHAALFSSPIDALLSISADETITRFDLASLSITASAPCPSHPTALAYDAAYDRVFLAHADSTISVLAPGILSIRKPRLLSTIRQHRAPVRCLAYHDESRMLISGDEDGVLILSEVGGPGEEGRSKVRMQVAGHGQRVTCVGLSTGSGEWVLSGDAEGRVMLTRRESGLVMFAFQAHEDAVRSIVLRQNLLVTTSQDKTCKAWHLH